MRLLFPALLAASALVTVPANAQTGDLAAVQRHIADLEAELARLKAQVQDLSQPQAAPVPTPPAAVPAAPAPNNVAAEPAAAADSGTRVTWKGAPEVSGEGSWSFKPRGRLQLDTGWIGAPSSLDAGDSLGFATEVRRAF